jgi:steroid 5-alpha reductase family enzyme
MASGWLSSLSSDPTRPPDVRVQVGEQKPHNLYLQPSSGGSSRSATNRSTASAPTAYVDTTHSKTHVHNASLFDVGILKDTLIPSLSLHSGLAILAYGAARYTNRVEAKDWLWPSGQVVNAWWSAVGRRLVEGYTVSQAFNRLSWHERVILTGVTLWGGRLFYRIARRSIQRGEDDPRYAEVKKEEGFWNSALFKVFIPEAFFQMLISLPFTAPFRHEGAVMTGYHPIVQMFAVGLFSSGLAMETLADYQLDQFKAEGNKGIMREGVWSIVRNPKYVPHFQTTHHFLILCSYLGDALVHISFIVMLYGSDMLAPIELLGPAANYAFLRFFGGDAEKEKHQERRYSASQPDKFRELEKFRADKNAFWPSVDELSNKWLWTVLGVGGLGIAVEQTLRALH